MDDEEEAGKGSDEAMMALKERVKWGEEKREIKRVEKKTRWRERYWCGGENRINGKTR